MDLSNYRASDLERSRTADIASMFPVSGTAALDIGARDGHFSRILAERFESVTALDLELPIIEITNVECVVGDIRRLEYDDNSFDLVLCAEVLEHIHPDSLKKACSELSRVTRQRLVIGVPYKQDIRIGRTTCRSCGAKNPPWGHVNRFDKEILARLFPDMVIERVSLVGSVDKQTNWLSVLLMDLAGNPYGTYDQEEPCVSCQSTLDHPPKRTPLQKVFSSLALYARSLTRPFSKPHANWIHILFCKPDCTTRDD